MPRRVRFALLALFGLALALYARGSRTPERRTAPPLDSAVLPAEPQPRAAPRVRRRATPVDAGSAASASCAPSAAQRCLGGDVWLVDGCGRGEEKLDECEARACREDECDPAPNEPCTAPPEGRCRGEVVELCLAGRPITVDCRAKGLRCGYGDEGAQCEPKIAESERCTGAVRCAGDVLLRCDDGQIERVDCAALRAKCLSVEGGPPTCLTVRTPDLTLLPCGPCGCPADDKRRETQCDGRDEDGDALVDEGLSCGPIPIIAFIVTDAQGQTSHAREDVEAEVRELNAALARTEAEGELSFELAELTLLNDPQLVALDSDEFAALASDPRVHPVRDGFYVPLVFTDVVLAGGETPKPGVSTLPNGTCGSMQQGYGPEVGLVAVAKGRYPTTVAHELGHFLGLCHTHDQQEAEPFVAYSDEKTGKLERCGESCRGRGDGICDTPFDPGPELCGYGELCRASCSVDASPDTENLMSYYAACRARFSREQVALMQHTAALRRAWHRCAGANCPCTLGAVGCPVGMSCRPALLATGERAPRCALDGARAPGADCRFMEDCGRGAICVREGDSGRQRCARPCEESSAGCDCRPAGSDLSLCREDLSPIHTPAAP